jgi:uncharacterized coiled-coil protein SlyX
VNVFAAEKIISESIVDGKSIIGYDNTGLIATTDTGGADSITKQDSEEDDNITPKQEEEKKIIKSEIENKKKEQDEKKKEQEKTINDINTFLIESYKLKIDKILTNLNLSIERITNNDT